MIPILTLAVEGTPDDAAARKLAGAAGFQIGKVHNRRGKARIDSALGGFNSAARFSPWLVLRDFDRDAPCPGMLVAQLLPNPQPLMVFRVVVNELESWLLGDVEEAARFLAIPARRVPEDPENLSDPKAEMIRLAGKSRKRAIREDMSPRPGSFAREGPAYQSRVSEFAQNYWRPEIAARRCPSLRRCILALQALRRRLTTTAL